MPAAAFTSDFDRARAGYSPDRLDALVWALTDLLIQPMNAWGWYELQRKRAEEATAGNKPPPEDPDHIPRAPGSVEYEQAMRKREECQRKAEEARIAQQQAEAAAAQAQQAPCRYRAKNFALKRDYSVA